MEEIESKNVEMEAIESAHMDLKADIENGASFEELGRMQVESDPNIMEQQDNQFSGSNDETFVSEIEPSSMDDVKQELEQTDDVVEPESTKEEPVSEKVDEKVDNNEIKNETSEPEKEVESGRNRRVRQKNRYFLDFHCIDLTKGGRSNKDDYDSFSLSSHRSTNRSSVNQSNNSNGSNHDEPEVFETKYCRKCAAKTCHDNVNGCQGCVYKKIVEASKKQKSAGHKGRPSNTKNQRHQQDGSNITKTNNHSYKRKPPKQRSTPATITSSSSTSSSTTATTNVTVTTTTNQVGQDNIVKRDSVTNTSAINDGILDNELTTGLRFGHTTNLRVYSAKSKSAATQNLDKVLVKEVKGDQTLDIEQKQQQANNKSIDLDTVDSGTASDIGAINTSTNTNNNISDNNGNSISDKSEILNLESWSPDEVAAFILSKGFKDEANLFKTQSVDGISLLLMQRTDFTYGLKIKLGPALKIYDQVCRLKRDYFRL